eukprot:TRINITY_DN6926_c0_g1_i2.p1 TRINITY_DN6926_c0_g1~~TRINITY_DN6926_c0_g1_i2.p1  ORF type:complete len:401 (+),score=119.00 TRINITY_DN6926_c0_g1_i2:116-1318(+)
MKRCGCALVVLLLVAALCGVAAASSSPPRVLFEWSAVDFADWPSEAAHAAWLGAGSYKDCMPAGVKVSHSGTVYVSMPRWRGDVPATLAVVVPNATGSALNPLLRAFPSWDMNAVGNPDALQSVLGFEIDAQERMWILDQGKVNGQPAIAGSIKLIVWDLKTNKLVQKYVFSAEEASLTQSFLNDVVVNQKDQFAYITDSGIPVDTSLPMKPGILVYNFAENKARRVLDTAASTSIDPNLWIHINNESVLRTSPMQTGADGIALTPDCSVLFFCPLTSHFMFNVETSLLNDFSTDLQSLDAQTRLYGSRDYASDGLAFDNKGTLLLTSLEHSGVFTWWGDALATDAASMVWPDTIGFDHAGNLLFVSNQLHLWNQQLLPWDGTVNFRLWSVYTGTDSYLN